MNDYVFSWAENAAGQMVHVDSVPNGVACDCHCPRCKEPLLARHGMILAHGFAHHSETRKATLKICYKVIMYKVAEQLIQTHKRIYAPSYYGIFPKKELVFTDVRIDSQYERKDKQPDIIATGTDGKEYLIEFIFDYKVQHKQPIDYANMTCLEIDLSRQSLETLEGFLFTSTDDRIWLNNQNYFDSIENRYKKVGKNVRVIFEYECFRCPLSMCVGVKPKFSSKPLVIKNSGDRYRLCKTEEYASAYQAMIKEAERKAAIEKERQRKRAAYLAEKRRIYEKQRGIITAPAGERSCFNCQYNLSWKNWGGTANCGLSHSLRLPACHSPEEAIQCPRFRPK